MELYLKVYRWHARQVVSHFGTLLHQCKKKHLTCCERLRFLRQPKSTLLSLSNPVLSLSKSSMALKVVTTRRTQLSRREEVIRNPFSLRMSIPCTGSIWLKRKLTESMQPDTRNAPHIPHGTGARLARSVTRPDRISTMLDLHRQVTVDPAEDRALTDVIVNLQASSQQSSCTARLPCCIPLLILLAQSGHVTC